MPSEQPTVNFENFLRLLKKGFIPVGALPNEPEPIWTTLNQKKTAKSKIGFLFTRNNLYYLCQYNFLRHSKPIKFDPVRNEPIDDKTNIGGFFIIETSSYSWIRIHIGATKEHPFEKKILVLKEDAKLPGHKFLAGPYYDSSTAKLLLGAISILGADIFFLWYVILMINRKSSNFLNLRQEIENGCFEIFEEGALTADMFCDDTTQDDVDASYQVRSPYIVYRALSSPSSPVSSPIFTGISLSLPAQNSMSNLLSVPVPSPLSISRPLTQRNSGSPSSSPLVRPRKLSNAPKPLVFDFNPPQSTEECTLDEFEESFQLLLDGSCDEVVKILKNSKHPADLFLEYHKKARTLGRLELLDPIYATFLPQAEMKDENPVSQLSFFVPADPLIKFIETPTKNCNDVEISFGVQLVSRVLATTPMKVLDIITSPERTIPALELLLDLDEKIQKQKQKNTFDLKDCVSDLEILFKNYLPQLIETCIFIDGDTYNHEGLAKFQKIMPAYHSAIGNCYNKLMSERSTLFYVC